MTRERLGGTEIESDLADYRAAKLAEHQGLAADLYQGLNPGFQAR